MRRIIFLTLAALFFGAWPAHAQLFRRPVVQQIIHSPIVNDLVNFGLSQVLPGFPPLPLPGSGSNSSILVDSSVKGNLDASAKNLQDADDITSALLARNKVAVDSTTVKPANANDAQYLALIKKGNDALIANDFAAAKDAYAQALQVKAGDLTAYTLFQEATSKAATAKLTADIAAVKKAIAPAPKLTALTIVKDDTVTTMKATDSKDVTIKLSAAAPANLLLEASAKDLDDTKLSGIGTIKKGDTSGKVTIIANDIPADLMSITISISATPTTAATSTTINIMVTK